jgi:hypothetical protein
MPTLNPDPSDKININGITLTRGLTLPGTPTTGILNSNISGLKVGTTYYFAVVAFSDISGYSGWAGPIVVFTQPEIRPAINAFSWNWPFPWVWSGNSWIKSDNNKNLIAYSQDFDSSNGWALQNLSVVSTDNTAPDDTQTATLFYSPGGTPGLVYSALRQEQFDLKPGTTYTFSYYRNITLGSTGGSFRFRNVTGTTPIDNIEPAITYTGSGWQRYAITYTTGPYQTAIDLYALSRNNSEPQDVGATFYIWGVQLEEGSTATEYSRSFGYTELRGGSYGATMATYTYNQDAWLNYGPNNGITYVWPFVSFNASNIDQLAGWTRTDQLQRVLGQFQSLPIGKRAFQPTIMNREDWYSLVGDRVSVSGAPSRNYWGNTFPFPNINEPNYYPSPWSDFGLSAGSQFYNELLNIFGSTGITLDYVFGDNESGFPTNFSITAIEGATTSYVNDMRYYNSWRGLSSWNDLMNVYGVTVQNILGPASYQSNDKVAYVVWNNITLLYQTLVNNEMFGNPTLQRYPKSIVSNYNYYVSDGGPTYGAPDVNGHPHWPTSIVGNAASPLLYGEINQIDNTVSPGNVVVNPNDPTFLILAVSGAVGATLAKGPWTSFIQAMQTLRSAKRGGPNIPITPWITSVKDAGIPVYNDSRVGPTIGLVDAKAGYYDVYGYTLGGDGNSAYYYELVKHVCLHGVQSIGYFNPASFNKVENGVPINDRNYWARGLTTYVDDIYLFNETLKEINNKIGGFTLTTADASRISWLAPYVASGAPGPNGITWWWRITTNPGNTTFVNGQTLSVANNNIVGTWVSTTGPTLAGIQIQIQ